MDEPKPLFEDTRIVSQQEPVASRVLPELLSEIFLQSLPWKVANDDGDSLISTSDFPADKGCPAWTSITHVCQIWREICLNCPQFWCIIPKGTSNSRFQAHIERSRGLTLFVELDIDRCASPGALIMTMLLDNMSRTTHLVMTGCSDINLEDVLRKLNAPAPLLESLVIDVRAEDLIVVPQLFGGIAPRLRHVEVADLVELSRASLPMSELRTLHYGWSSAFGDAMSLLSAMPNLKVLHIDGFTDFSNNDFSETTAVAELKNLTSFRFFARPLRDLLFLLLRTQIAPAARLDLSLAMDGDVLPRTTSWAQTVDLLAMHLRRAREVQGPFRDLALRVGLHYGIFIGWTDAFPPDFESVDERPWYTSNWEASPRHAALSFSYAAPRNQWKKREPYLDMYRTCSRFDITHVRNLWLSVDLSHRDSNDRELQPFLKQAAKVTNWRSTLSLALNVSTLKASKDAARGVLDTLIPAASEEGQSAEEAHVLCPKLETLVIMDAQIGTIDERTVFSELIECLESRQACGKGIRKLVLQNCLQSVDEVQVLARFAEVEEVGKWGNYGKSQAWSILRAMDAAELEWTDPLLGEQGSPPTQWHGNSCRHSVLEQTNAFLG